MIQKPKKRQPKKRLHFKRAASHVPTHIEATATRGCVSYVKYHDEPFYTLDEDATYIQFTSYGGINHRNRDRKGGHFSWNEKGEGRALRKEKRLAQNKLKNGAVHDYHTRPVDPCEYCGEDFISGDWVCECVYLRDADAYDQALWEEFKSDRCEDYFMARLTLPLTPPAARRITGIENKGDHSMNDTHEITGAVGIKDALVKDIVRVIGMHSESEMDMVAHAALVFWVVTEMGGYEDSPALKVQLADSADRIIASLIKDMEG